MNCLPRVSTPVGRNVPFAGCRQVVILAGGMGTRLAAVTGGLPKALVPIGGYSVLERQLALAGKHGIEHALLLLGQGAEQVVAWVETHATGRLQIDWMIEPEPLGNGGALLAAISRLERRFLVFFADQLLDFDVRRFIRHYEASGDAMTIVVHPNDHPHDSDLLDVDHTGHVTAIHRPPHRADRPRRNVVNAATYLMERRCLEAVAAAAPRPADLARDLLPLMIAAGVRIGAYRSREYLKDMGTPERLAKVTHDLEAGHVMRRRADNLLPAILLDRDGTVNVEVGRITRPDELKLVPGIGSAINHAHAAGYLVGVVTNQAVIARGDVTHVELDAIHGRMEMLLAESGAFVDGIYVCPHHPDSGFPGEVAALKGPCNCRKPATGLVEQAVTELGLDASQTWLIGDTTSDVQCAASAGLFCALVETGHAGTDDRFPSHTALRFEDAPSAIEFIVRLFPDLWNRCVATAQRTSQGDRILVRAADITFAANASRLLAEAARRQGLSVVPMGSDGGGAGLDRGVTLVPEVDPTVGADTVDFLTTPPMP